MSDMFREASPRSSMKAVCLTNLKSTVNFWNSSATAREKRSCTRICCRILPLAPRSIGPTSPLVILALFQ